MKIIGLLNTKGGTGKSTSTLLLALGLEKIGYKVIVIDTDAPQFSVVDWWHESRKTFPVFACKSKSFQIKDNEFTGREFNEHINLAEYDYVIIDSGRDLTSQSQSVVRICDLAIIPIQPSGADARKCSDLIEMIKKRNEATKKPLTVFLITRDFPNTLLSRNIHQFLFHNYPEISILKNRINNSMRFIENLGAGESIFDYNDLRAKILADKVLKLCIEIKEKLNGET